MSFISFPTDPNTMNRSELQKNMVDAIVDGMDMEMLCQLACDALSTTYDGYSDSELMEEVKEYYPHLLEEETDFGALKQLPMIMEGK